MGGVCGEDTIHSLFENAIIRSNTVHDDFLK